MVSQKSGTSGKLGFSYFPKIYEILTVRISVPTVLRVNPSTMYKIFIDYISRSRSNQSSCIYSLPGPNIEVQSLILLSDVGRGTACRRRASPALHASSSHGSSRFKLTFSSSIAPVDPSWSKVSTAVFSYLEAPGL